MTLQLAEKYKLGHNVSELQYKGVSFFIYTLSAFNHRMQVDEIITETLEFNAKAKTKSAEISGPKTQRDTPNRCPMGISKRAWSCVDDSERCMVTVSEQVQVLLQL